MVEVNYLDAEKGEKTENLPKDIIESHIRADSDIRNN